MGIILSKYVMPGNRVDLQKIQRVKEETENKGKTYQSQVIDIISDDRIEIAMPMDKSKLILLPVDAEYDLCFFTANGLYQCDARVVDRYKSNNIYILLLDLTSNLRKYQRREYYRFSCALEMNSRPLQEEEINAIEQHAEMLMPGLPLQRSVIVDISGGGLRFVADYAYEVDSLILCRYQLWIENESKDYSLVGKVLSAKEVANRPGVYEHRVQYVNIESGSREEIIKYIFDEERKTIKNQKGV